MIEFRPSLRKICRIYKNPCGAEECYWNAKHHQRKPSNLNEKTGYELVGVILDKMIKHGTVFALSKPIPSEADIIIKIWADLFEVLFFNTGIYIRCDDIDHILFKLDAKLVLAYDDTEYPVSRVKFALYSGPKKIKTDRSKLLVEAKTIYNQVMGLNISEENEALLKITNVQIMGLEAHVMSIITADDHLYVANSIELYILSSTVSQLKTQSKSLIGCLFDFKHYTLNTANIIKQGLNDKKKSMKSMKRKMQEDVNNEETSPPPKRKLTPIWRYKKNAKN